MRLRWPASLAIARSRSRSGPQADAIERAFAKFGARQELVTDGGHREKVLPAAVEGESAATDSQ
jgi:hypothetical protein